MSKDQIDTTEETLQAECGQYCPTLERDVYWIDGHGITRTCRVEDQFTRRELPHYRGPDNDLRYIGERRPATYGKPLSPYQRLRPWLITIGAIVGAIALLFLAAGSAHW